MHTAYISQHCPICSRFMDGVRSSPQASQEIKVVDIDRVNARIRESLSVVPTLQTSDGRMLAGSEAFTFLKSYEEDIQLGAWECGPSDLMFSDFTIGDGTPQVVGHFERFEPLP